MTPLATSAQEPLRAKLRTRALDYAGYHAGDYIALHPDLASSRPDDHFVAHGLWEGRPAAAPERFAARLAQARRRAFRDQPPQQNNIRHLYRSLISLKTSLHAPLPLSLATSELMSGVLTCLAPLGLVPDIFFTPPRKGDGRPIVFDPLALFGGISSETADLELYQSCLFVTGKMPWERDFSAELPFLFAAGAIGALEADTFALMTSAGAPAAWLSLQTFNAALSPPAGRTAGLGRAVNASNPTHPWCARPVDVAAIQPLTAERAETWKLIAAGMSGLTTILRPDDGGSASERSLRRHIFNRSKTVLHLEGEGFAPPPWRWLDDVAAAGAALVSEPLPHHPLLHEGVDYFEASAQQLPGLINELINTAQGRAKAEAAAASLHNAFAARSDPERNGLEIVSLLNTLPVSS